MSVRSLQGRFASSMLSVLVLSLGTVALAAQPASAAFTGAVQQTWGTNGRVSEILRDPSGAVFVAGDFTAVTDSAGNVQAGIQYVAKFNPATGKFDTTWDPNPDGPVLALALSGGNLYMGGAFTNVSGSRRQHLAAVSAGNGALDTTWRPGANAGVSALAASTNSVFVGGSFSTVNGASRPYLAKVDATGSVDSTWNPKPNARVRSMVLSGDATLYVGGDFTTVNGNSAGKSIASLSTSGAGSLTSGFNAGITNSGAEPPAIDLDLDGSTLLAAVAGSGGACAALNSSNGSVSWSKHANGNMQAVTAMGGIVYCGGHFGGVASFAGYDRYKLAAVTESGSVQPFSPRINSPLGVWSLDNDGSHLFAGGDFTKISGKLQSHFAMFG